MTPDVITVLQDNRVVTQVAGAEVLLPMAIAASAANTAAANAAADRSEAAFAEIEEFAAGAPDAPSILNKLNKSGDNVGTLDPAFATAAKRVNIIVRNTPFGFGAVGNDPVRDTAALNQMKADGVKVVTVTGSLMANQFMPGDDMVFEAAEGATYVRNPDSLSNYFFRATGKTGIRFYGGQFDGLAGDGITPHTLLSFDSGCSNIEVDGVRFLRPKRGEDGSWGGCITVADPVFADRAATVVLSRLRAQGLSEDPGSFAFLAFRACGLVIRDLNVSGFFNGPLYINDPVLPVPDELTQKIIDIRGVYSDDCGSGVTIYSQREGQTEDGLDVLGQKSISGRIQISHCTSIKPRNYGFFVQGEQIEASHITVQDGNSDPEELFGGILFSSDGGSLTHFTVVNAPGIALELGGSLNTTAGFGSIRGDSVIAVNAGASLGANLHHTRIDGPATGVLMSGYDGADATNWFKKKGRDIIVEQVDYVARRSTDRFIKATNAFQNVKLINTRSHVKHAGALGKTYDLRGATGYSLVGQVEEIDETNADARYWSGAISRTSGAGIIMPDHTQILTVTGGSACPGIRTAGEAAEIGCVHEVFCNEGQQGTGFDETTTFTFTHDGTEDPIVQPVISGGKLIGGYVIFGGADITTCTAAASVGTGATIQIVIGPPLLELNRDLLLKFTGAATIPAITSGTDNVNLTTAFAADGLGISTLPLLGNYNSWTRKG